MEYYGMTNEEQIVLLGEFDGWEGASDEADRVRDVMWIFDKPAILRFRESIDTALGALSSAVEAAPVETPAEFAETRREDTEDADMRPRAEELGLKHVWYGRYRGDIGEVTLTFAGGAEFGVHVTAFAEFGGKRAALSQVLTTLKRARELGYDAWCCDGNPGYGGYIAPKKK